jgi:hypothetical protein
MGMGYDSFDCNSTMLSLNCDLARYGLFDIVQCNIGRELDDSEARPNNFAIRILM